MATTTTNSTSSWPLGQKKAICKKHGIIPLFMITVYYDIQIYSPGVYRDYKLCWHCAGEFLERHCKVVTEEEGLLFEAAKAAWKKDE